jgi:signal transduction histidine kinase
LKESHETDYPTDYQVREKVGYFRLKVRLVSNDRALYSTCRKVLVKHQDTTWDFACVPKDPEPDADLYVWDYEADPSLNGVAQVAHKINIFVVERENLAALRAQFDTPPVWTMLKPVNAMLLEEVITDLGLTAPKSPKSKDNTVAELHRVREDRDNILQALLECNLLLQEMDQARNGIVIQSYRELRSPLMAALGYCRLMLDQQLGTLNPEQQKVIQRMQQSIQRLFRLSSSMLQLAMGPDVRLQPRFQQADIEECIEKAIAEATPFADARNLAIQREITPPAGRFLFDPEQILQVLASLLDSAVRSTPRSGQITIRALPVFWDRRARNMAEGAPDADRRGRQVVAANAYRIEVHDPGLNLRQAALDKVPELVAGEQSGEKPSPPFAFGLAMCQQIVDSHRGRILAEADETGYFAVELPYIPGTEWAGSAPNTAAGRSPQVEA